MNRLVFLAMSNTPFISFIVPVYNEEHNIANMLHNLHSVLKANPHWDWEIVIVEDGSSDNTQKVIKEEIKKYENTHLLIHEVNKGWVVSFKDGLQKAKGRYFMYIGADEEFDSSELPSFVEPLLHDETDLILGVRWQRNAYKLFRFFISINYIFLLNGLFKLRVNDYNWSQAWNREIFEKIQLTSTSLFVLPEIIIKSYDLKFRVTEVPSNHRGRQAGKSSLNSKIMGHALIEAIQFWFYRITSSYNPGLKDGETPFLSPRSQTNQQKETPVSK